MKSSCGAKPAATAGRNEDQWRGKSSCRCWHKMKTSFGANPAAVAGVMKTSRGAKPAATAGTTKSRCGAKPAATSGRNEDQLWGKASCRSWQEGDPHNNLTIPARKLTKILSRTSPGEPKISCLKSIRKSSISSPGEPQISELKNELQPVAKVDADIYRILNANVAVIIFKPFSFVKDSVGGDIINSEVSFPYVQSNISTDDCSSAAISLVTSSVNTS